VWFKISAYEDFYLVVHNIDGAMLRGEKTQTILSLLAQVEGVHILASVDQINAPLSKLVVVFVVTNPYPHGSGCVVKLAKALFVTRFLTN
jgi:hypothetical protein